MSKKTYSEKLKDPRWQKKRLKVLQRDDWKCTSCDETKKTLSVHHLHYRYGLDPWEYESDELLTLCQHCHDLTHEYSKLLELKIKRIFDWDKSGFSRDSISSLLLKIIENNCLDKPYNDGTSRLIDKLIVMSDK